MFGEYPLEDFEIERGSLSLSVRKSGKLYIYRRVLGENELTKKITNHGKLIINPVEPVNVPKSVTHFVEIEFEKHVLVGPKSKLGFYAKIPIDIGVFLKNGKLKVLDVFTLNDYVKYTLYGTPKKGVVCRHYVSDVYDIPPKVDNTKEGILELEIENTSDEWVEMGKVVLDVYGMKLYYDEFRVVTKAVVCISRGVAETQFVDGRYNMKRALEIYVARGLHILRRSFVMEWGLC